MTSRGFEWKTKRNLFGLPLICVAFGRDEAGRLRVARGIVAVGQFAFGVVAFGQFAFGLLFAFGQVAAGLTAIGQLAMGLGVAGQFAAGYLAFGQVVLGVYALGQVGWGTFVWSNQRDDMEALSVFFTLKMILTGDFFVCSKVWSWVCQTMPDLFSSPQN